MISTLLSAALAITAPQQTVPQQIQRPELKLHPIEDVINLQEERRLALEKRFTMDLVSMAFAEQNKNATGLEALPLKLLGGIMDKAVDSESPGPLLEGGQMGMFLTSAEPQSDRPFKSVDDLLTNVKSFMQPAFERRTQSLKIERHGDARVLLAYLVPEQQEWLTQFLELQRNNQGWAATVQSSLYLGPSDGLKIPGLSKNGALPLTGSGGISKMEELLVGGGFEMLTNPKVLALPGQEAEVAVKSQLSYIKSWELITAHPGPTEYVDPTVQTIDYGMELLTRVLQVSENQFGILVDTEYSKIKMPIPSKSVTIKGRKLVISVPELVSAEIETTMILPDGGGVILKLANELDPGKTLYFLLEFHRVEMAQIGIDKAD